MSSIKINEGTAQEARRINDQVPEFNGSISEDFFFERMARRDPLILIALADGLQAGYLFAYDKYEDGSFYCSRAAVLPEYRRQGILRALMARMEEFAGAKGYKKIKVTTKNERRGMLHYLVQGNYNFVSVSRKTENGPLRIDLEKNL